MMKSPIHQRGSGLFISFKSKSQTWPVELSLAITVRLDAMKRSTKQSSRPITVAAAIKTDQPLEKKSLISNLLGWG